ncbi:MAG: hypothetical protein FJ267_17855 [Planctomycetes bacterium]|nr:hypothetical protein [Planctomycetota bacterium]
MIYQDIYSKFVSAMNGWDQLDDFNLQLYKAVLAIDIGRFKAGTTVDTIAFNLVGTNSPVIQIYQGDMVYEYPVLEVDVKFGNEKSYPQPE